MERRRRRSELISDLLCLQHIFDRLWSSFSKSGFDFRSSFVKYLRLCGGDECLSRVNDVFDLWLKKYKPADSVGVDEEDGSEIEEDIEVSEAYDSN